MLNTGSKRCTTRRSTTPTRTLLAHSSRWGTGRRTTRTGSRDRVGTATGTTTVPVMHMLCSCTESPTRVRSFSTSPSTSSHHCRCRTTSASFSHLHRTLAVLPSPLSLVPLLPPTHLLPTARSSPSTRPPRASPSRFTALHTCPTFLPLPFVPWSQLASSSVVLRSHLIISVVKHDVHHIIPFMDCRNRAYSNLRSGLSSTLPLPMRHTAEFVEAELSWL